MGCDIHFFSEKRNPRTGKWEKLSGFVSDDAHHYSEDAGVCEVLQLSDSLVTNRNYDLFAILADVRNGYNGFVDRGDKIEPIAYPKGLPDDVSEEIRHESEDWGCDGHSHTWLTLKEVFEYLSNDGIETMKVKRAYVTARGYQEFLKTGNPYPCCGDVSGHNVVKVSNDHCIAYQNDHPDKSVYTQIEWAVTVVDCAKWFFTEGLRQLKERSETEDFSDVRMVFWFDN